MRCRTFEVQVADWQASKLPEAISVQMAAHQKSCARCAQIAASEADIRRRFSGLPEPVQSSDIWPRLSAAISQSETELRRAARGRREPRRPLFRLSHQWGYAAAVVAAAPVAIWIATMHPRPLTTALPPVVRVANSARQSVAAPAVSDASITTFAVDLLGGSGQSDSSVDDPLGTSMEHVWTDVNTNMKRRSAE